MTETNDNDNGKRALLLMENGKGLTIVDTFEASDDYKSPIRACKAFLSEVAKDPESTLYRPLYDQKLFIVPVKTLEPVQLKTQTRVV